MSLDPELIEQWMGALGMPPAHWAHIATRGTILTGPAVQALDVTEATGPHAQPILSGLRVETAALRRWAGFAFELFGLVADQPSTEWPSWTFDIPLTGGRTRQVCVQVWRQTAWAADAPLYASVVWSPALGVVRSIRVESDEWTSSHLKQAGEAMRLITQLGELHRRGKQPGDGRLYSDPRQFRADLARAVFEAQRTTGLAQPPAVSVARRLGLSKASFYRYVQDFTGKRWTDAEAELLRIRETGTDL